MIVEVVVLRVCVCLCVCMCTNSSKKLTRNKLVPSRPGAVWTGQMDSFFLIYNDFFSIIAGLQCSLTFLLYTKLTQSNIHVCILFSHIIVHHHKWLDIVPSAMDRFCKETGNDRAYLVANGNEGFNKQEIRKGENNLRIETIEKSREKGSQGFWQEVGRFPMLKASGKVKVLTWL